MEPGAVHVVMGATGGVGGAVARTLLDRGEQVTVVARDPERARALAARGAHVEQADATDPVALRRAFDRGDRAFLLAPLGDLRGDVDAQQRRMCAAIVAALDGSGLQKVVLASTYGARSGERIGDLATLWELEEALFAQPIPAAVNRGAYYMSNWAFVIDGVRADGILSTMLPADRRIPTVAPDDVGRAAADRLQSGLDDVGVRWVEGPEEVSPADVAGVLAGLLGRDVEVRVTPREQWLDRFSAEGLSAESAESFAGMTAVTVDEREPAVDPVRGSTTLEAYLRSRLP